MSMSESSDQSVAAKKKAKKRRKGKSGKGAISESDGATGEDLSTVPKVIHNLHRPAKGTGL